MSKVNKRQLIRTKRQADAGIKLQKQWDKLLTSKGLSLNRGASDKLSYVGSSVDLVVIEKLNQKSTS